MAVTVRLFAALRDAAGTARTEAAPGTVPDIVAELRRRYGEPFASRVAVANGVLDDDPVRLDEPVTVPDGAELTLLPPFSGGAADAPPPAGSRTSSPHERRLHTLLLVGSLLVPALLGLAVAADRTTFAIVVGVIAVGSLVDLHVALGGVGVRTVLPGAVVVAAAPVVLLVVWPAAATTWLPGLVALGVMLTFLLAVASQRRQETAMVFGSTVLSGLLVAFGAGALLLLFEAIAPSRLMAVLALIAAADLAAVLAARRRRRPAMRHLVPAAIALAVPAAIVVQATVGWLDSAVPVVGFAIVAVLAAVASARFRHVLRRPDLVERPPPALLIGTADAVLFGVPLTALWLQLLAL